MLPPGELVLLCKLFGVGGDTPFKSMGWSGNRGVLPPKPGVDAAVEVTSDMSWSVDVAPDGGADVAGAGAGAGADAIVPVDACGCVMPLGPTGSAAGGMVACG